MLLEIITPEQKVFEGEAESVQLPGIDGLFEVLNHHAAMVSALGTGQVRVRTAGKDTRFGISGGVVEVLNNKVTVLADGMA